MRFARTALLQLSLLAIGLDVSAYGDESKPRTLQGQNADEVIQLFAKQATIHGRTAYVRPRPFLGSSDICTWTDPQDWVSWQLSLKRSGDYVVDLRYSCAEGSEGSTFEVSVGNAKLTGKIAKPTASWEHFQTLKVGTVRLNETGNLTLSIKPLSKPGSAVMNLCRVRLVPAEQYEALAKAESQNPLFGMDRPVMVIPNFHPASCGWLTDFSTERNYCGYSYLKHLDRVRDDPTYGFAISEVNNMMAILAFEPERFEELKQRVREGRVELCNAFFLEPSISLSGGEALVKSGIEGLRWQQKVVGARPRLAWMIDVCGVHEQMGQIVSGLGLDAMMYCRYNPTDSIPHWQQSPDGSQILAMANDTYADFDLVFGTQSPLTPNQLESLANNVRSKLEKTPDSFPVYVLGGYGDYSIPPRYKGYTQELVKKWDSLAPKAPITFSGPGKYLDAILPLVRSGKVQLPTSKSGTPYGWTSFWTECPRVKALYRQSEHRLQATEALSAVASLQSPFEYPVAPLYHSWLMMCLNMDRNTLWGAAGGMVFEHPTSWDALDRFNKVRQIADDNTQKALWALLGEGSAIGLFNPMNGKRTAPFLAKLPKGTHLAGATCQDDDDGQTLCRLDMPAFSAAGVALAAEPPQPVKAIATPETFETPFYSAKLDPNSGALVSLKLKPSGREMLSGPVSIVAEQGGDYHDTPERTNRKRLADSSQGRRKVSVARGPVATVARSHGSFYGGGQLIETIRFYADSPEIDFEVVTEKIPAQTVIVAEIPLAGAIKESRRGIPYGFSHGTVGTPTPEMPGNLKGIMPAIRWSDYALSDGGGVAILDRGLPGRELNGNTPLLFLLNAHDTYMGYRCSWLSGKPRQTFRFALYAHEGDWNTAQVPQRAWEYNCPPLVVSGVKPSEAKSFVQTSDNVIVESLRREGQFLEMRLVECLGHAGTAKMTLALPHGQAFLTDLTGGHPQPLAGGPDYEFPVRPQQIVTLRFATDQPVKEIQPLLKWDELVPPAKLPRLLKKLPNAVGHPPQGNEG
jgi:alpha-mannosidase